MKANSYIEHQKELKIRLLIISILFFLIFIFLLLFNDAVVDFILSIGKKAGYSFFTLSPQEAFLCKIKVSFTLATVISIPILLSQVIAFILPVFNKKAARSLYMLLIISSFLFSLGAFFSLKVLLPFIISYFKSLSNDLKILNEASLSSYLSLIFTLSFAVGAVFLMPVACFFLGKMGLLTEKTMKKAFPFAVILILLFSALITPPDVISQLLLSIPMAFLYFISSKIVKLQEKR